MLTNCDIGCDMLNLILNYEEESTHYEKNLLRCNGTVTDYRVYIGNSGMFR